MQSKLDEGQEEIHKYFILLHLSQQTTSSS